METTDRMLTARMLRVSDFRGVEHFYDHFDVTFSGPDPKETNGLFYFFVQGTRFVNNSYFTSKQQDVIAVKRTPEEAWELFQELKRRLDESDKYFYDVITKDVIDPEGIVYPGGEIKKDVDESSLQYG